VSAKKTGRPTKFTPEFLAEGERLASIGISHKDMAYFWGISEDSVTRWKKGHPDFAEALKRGDAKKKVALMSALFRNATKKDNVAAQIFLAKNWLGMSDRQDIGLGLPSDGEGDGTLTIEVVHTRAGGGNGKGGNGDGKGNGEGHE